MEDLKKFLKKSINDKLIDTFKICVNSHFNKRLFGHVIKFSDDDIDAFFPETQNDIVSVIELNINESWPVKIYDCLRLSEARCYNDDNYSELQKADIVNLSFVLMKDGTVDIIPTGCDVDTEYRQGVINDWLKGKMLNECNSIELINLIVYGISILFGYEITTLHDMKAIKADMKKNDILK